MPITAATVFDALGDPRRRDIVERLGRRPQPVGELAAQLPISRPAVSQHLRVLKEAGLVTESAVGTRRIYRLDRAGLAAVRDYLDTVWRQTMNNFAALAEAKHAKSSTTGRGK